MRRTLFVSALAAAFIAALTIAPSAQTKPAPGFADYGKWETLGAGGGGRGGGGSGLSNDGKWLSYSINRTNRQNELRLLNLATNKLTTEAFGSNLTFTNDSKWAAWSLGYSETEAERLRAQSRPVQNRLVILNLENDARSTIEGAESFAFSSDGKFVLVRKYMPVAAPAAGGAAAPAPAGGRPGGPGRAGGAAAPALDDPQPLGATVLIRNLATGVDMTFGNVGETAWQDTGAMLAMTISAADKAGNGVHLYNAATGALRVLDSSASYYSGLAWRRDSADLLVMRTKVDEKKDGSTHHILAWTGTGTGAEKLQTYDQTADSKFPANIRIVSFRRASWSEDGRSILLGLSRWEDKPASGRGSGTFAPGSGVSAPGSGAAAGGSASPADEPADVTVWHWKDADVASKQKISANADRRRNLLAVWHIGSGVTQIGRDFQENVQIIPRTNWAIAQEWGKYAMERSIGRPGADLVLIDLTTGARTPLKSGIGGFATVSSGGKYVLILQDDVFWTLNLATKALTNISKAAATQFINKESDQTTAQKPPFGTAGWTKDDASVLMYDKYDIWEVAADGTKARKLTNGAPEQVRHRYTRIDFSNPNEIGIDLSKPMYVALFGERTKKSGYGVLKPGSAIVDRLLFADKAIDRLGKARDAEVYVHAEQTYNDSPDLFVSEGGVSAGKQVTNTNAFQSDYSWGKSEIIDYVSEKTHGSQKLQGALYYPANYEPGKTYPMIVYMYELLSDGVHRYVTPSDTSYYNTSVFTTQGYFVLQPDITFRPREPGLSVVDCVVPAVKAVVAKGLADPKKVGIIGHSWGGFDTAFLATHTQGVFAAGVAGAAITNLVSNYGNGHWSSGIAETDHIETGQQRMAVPIYEDLQAYIRNSAVFNVANMTVPLLVEVGNVDGTVYWHQGVELYNIARRAKKNVVMIEYNAEDHSLSQRKNQIDYQRRILQWFGHYLKGEPAQTWISDGQSVIDRQDEVRKAAAGRGGRGGM